MELRHLRYFCSVAEQRSFSKASARLRVAQPSLSRQIRQLEGELGVDLFIRSSAGVQLTDAGEAFFGHAGRLLAQLAIAVSSAQEIGKGRGGSFIIGGDWRLPIDIVPQAVRRIRKLFPKVEVNLLDLPMHEHLMALRERRIHVGFVPSVYMGMAEGIDARRVMSCENLAVLPENHPLAKKSRLRVVDLRDEVWLMIDERNAPGVRNYYQQLFRLAQIAPRIGATSTSAQGILTRVSLGDGVALLPQSVLPDNHRGVAYVPMEIEPFEIYAIWPRDGASPLVRPFIDLLCAKAERTSKIA